MRRCEVLLLVCSISILFLPGMRTTRMEALAAANQSTGRAASLGAPEIRYRILGRFGEAFYCDPDTSPIGLPPGIMRRRALDTFAEIESDQQTFRAIVHHLGISSTTNLDDEQKVAVYNDFKKLRGAIYLEKSDDQFKFKIGLKQKSGDVAIQGLVNKDGKIAVLKREPVFLSCPVCLAADTRISTPGGPVSVQNIRVNDTIWTLNRAGERTAVPVLKTSAFSLLLPHYIVHLTLSDGRQLRISPGHPTVDGHKVGELQAGEPLDGSQVQSLELLPYEAKYTYDLLPAGDTGFYWANGVVLASTLR